MESATISTLDEQTAIYRSKMLLLYGTAISCACHKYERKCRDTKTRKGELEREKKKGMYRQ